LDSATSWARDHSEASGSGRISRHRTWAPASSAALAIVRPIPRPAPVKMIVRPLRLNRSAVDNVAGCQSPTSDHNLTSRHLTRRFARLARFRELGNGLALLDRLWSVSRRVRRLRGLASGREPDRGRWQRTDSTYSSWRQYRTHVQRQVSLSRKQNVTVSG
jgi:hypothetical protein